MTRSYIAGYGFHVPDRVVTNDDLAKIMDTSDEWIQSRTGIQTRHFAADGEGPSDLAVKASQRALDKAGMTVDDIDFIIFATFTSDHYAPGSGVFLQHKLGCGNIGAMDIKMQCSGFVYGLSVADQFIRTGTYGNILLVGAEVQSAALDLTNTGRDVSVLFGDGAGAVVVSATDEERGVLSTHLHSQGKFAKELWVPLPGTAQKPWITVDDIENDRHRAYMNGREVFRNAVTRFPEVINEALDANGITSQELALIVPHQANIRITKEVARRMKVSDEVVYSNIHKYGNTTAASIPIALCEALDEGKIKQDDYVMLAAFGSGFTWASALLKW